MILIKNMARFLRFPTGSRFGWLVLFSLSMLFAGLEDTFSSRSLLLDRLFQFLGVLFFIAFIYDLVSFRKNKKQPRKTPGR
jgi:hypothetical protein